MRIRPECRFQVFSVPHRDESGADWFVRDKETGREDEAADRPTAFHAAKRLNDAADAIAAFAASGLEFDEKPEGQRS